MPFEAKKKRRKSSFVLHYPNKNLDDLEGKLLMLRKLSDNSLAITHTAKLKES